MSRMTFSRNPYFDDFSSEKNFKKVLFKPGRPVQARELNQIQSLFQSQIEMFANHVFKNGTRVSNARASLGTKNYVRLQDLSPWKIDGGHPSGYPVDLSIYNSDITLYGTTSGIKARFIKGVNAENGDPPTVYVVYTQTAIDGETTSFIPGETIRFLDVNSISIYSVNVRCPGCVGIEDLDEISPTGSGQIFTIDAGIFYYEGMFIENAEQEIIVSKYGQTVSYKLGFDFIQTIETSDDDISLLDNSLGYPNATAPGADRYKVTLQLVKRTLDSEDGDNFILLATINNGAYNYLKSDSEYGEIMDMIAKRTYETNGDFTVQGGQAFKLRFIEDKAESVLDSKGYSVDGDEDYVRAVVGPGTVYVQGYRYENIADQFLKVKKARDTKKLPSFIKRLEERTYILLRPLPSFSVYPNNPSTVTNTDNTLIHIYDGPFSNDTPTGQVIGSFRVYDVYKLTGTYNHATPASRAVCKYWIYDLTLLPGKKLNEGLSFVDSASISKFKAEQSGDGLQIYNPNRMELLWKIDRDDVKTLRSIDSEDNGSIHIKIRKKLTGVLNAQGSISFTAPSGEYFMPFSNSTIFTIKTGSGDIYSLDLADRITVDSTTLTISLGTSPINVGGAVTVTPPGNNIMILHDVLKVNALEDKKQISFITLPAIVPTTDAIGLTVTDAVALEYVKEYPTGQPSDDGVDITSSFVLNRMDEDSIYKESTVTAIAGTPIPGNKRWRIRVKYFTRVSNGVGYFTVDSYKDLIADGDLNYEDGPVHTALNKLKYPLLSSFDFRPSIIGNNVTGSSIPSIGSTIIFDLEYYLGRADLLCANKDKNLYVKSGVSSDTPTTPKPDDQSIVLDEIYFKPYTHSVKDIEIKTIDNKRYTMRDIGKLEKRIENIEYYTVLSLLEKSAAEMNIKDTDGLDRFKNGFVADNFKDYQAADLTSIEFRCGYDRKSSELRPGFVTRNKKLSLVTGSSSAYYLGKMAILPFNQVIIDEQPFATKYLSINPYFQYKNTGNLVLSPNNDTWSDTTTLPNLTLTIDSGLQALNNAAANTNILETEWGSWADSNTTIINSESQIDPFHPEFGVVTVTTTTNTSTGTRTGVTKSIGSRTDNYNLGDRVTGVNIQPYMRATTIYFVATKLKANTKTYAFFDGKPVSQYCRAIGSAPGSQMITDVSGQLLGIFDCPAGIFFTGEKTFYLTNDKTKSSDPDLETSIATAQFFSGGLNVTAQNTSLNVISPTIQTTRVSDTRSSSSVITSATTTLMGDLNFIPCTECRGCAHCQDPVAQSFTLPRDHFITAFDVYFKDIDSEEREQLFFQIRDMANGYPGEKVLVTKNYYVSELTSSEDSTKPFHVEFDFPVFVKGGVSYCIVVGGWSPKTTIWLAKMGGEIINIPGKIIETQPAIGSSFRSQNASTWNAEQYEDLKYRIHVAKFTTKTMTLKFNPEFVATTLANNPLESETGERNVRVFASQHGFTANDTFRLSLLEKTWQEVVVNVGQLQIGQIMTTVGGFSGKITNIKTDQTKTYVTLSDIVGSFSASTNWTCSQMDWVIRDNYLITQAGYRSSIINNEGKIRYNQASGHFANDYLSNLNGIPLSELNSIHTVKAVDSSNSFTFETTTAANSSGRFGGIDVALKINEKYEVFNVSGAYLTYGASETWSYTGVGHNPTGGNFESLNYVRTTPKIFTIASDVHLDYPNKIVSSDNIGSGNRLAEIIVNFEAKDEWTTPVINFDTFSITTISNKSEWIADETYVIPPNASTRYIPESNPTLGSEPHKYVTKAINLANAASDLVIAFDVYKDIDSDFDVWIKVLNSDSNSNIDDLRWMRVVGYNKDYNSVDLTDRREYNLTLSTLQVEVYSTDTVFTTVDWDETTEFSSFKVKLVGKSRNPSKPVFFRSFRAIAVT